jgi:dTDP-4-dehydrorhamnose reductase
MNSAEEVINFISCMKSTEQKEASEEASEKVDDDYYSSYEVRKIEFELEQKAYMWKRISP